nr:P-loop NTPase fold protein [uncultured Campylobacter sp.]
MSTAKENIEQRLTEILQRDNAVCVVLDGEWGVGKTTFWKNFSNEKFKENSIYVSLFGKESIQEIKQEISLKFYYKKNKAVSKIEKCKKFDLTSILNFVTKRFADNKIAEFGLIMLDSLYTDKYKDAIICFDDFERISDKINLKDILGLISEYKEQQNCHIVMILNRSKMTAPTKETQKEDKKNLEDKELKNASQIKDNKTELERILSEYKDKIMDYEFYYDPTPQESFNIVSGELEEVYRDAASQYFAKHAINNIRVMRRAINALNDYKQHLEDKLQKYQPIKDNVITYILGISIINAMNSSAEIERLLGKLDYFDNLTDVYDLFKNRKNISDSEYVLVFSDDTDYYQLGMNILSYTKKSIIDAEEFNEIARNLITREYNSENKQYKEIKKEILDEYFKGVLDLRYDNDVFIKSLFAYLEINKENIIDIVGVSPFLLYIKTLEKFDEENKQKYHEFATRILLKYIRDTLENNQNQNLDIIISEEMINFDKRVRELRNSLITKNEIYKISSAERIIENIFNTRVSIQKELTSKITEEILEKYCYENLEFLRSAIGFLQRDISRLPDNKELKDKILKVFEKISKNGDENQKLKMKFILEDLKEKAHLE